MIGIAFSLYANAALIGIGIAAGLALLAYYSCINAKSQELSTYYKQEVIAQVLQSFFVKMPSSHPKRESRKVHSETVPCSLLPTVITQKT